MKHNFPRVLVVIPAYNVADQITRVINKVSLDLGVLVRGVLVVDNQSTDDTVLHALKSLSSISIRNQYLVQNKVNLGLGGSLKVGFRFALARNYSHVLVVHGDDQANPADFYEILENLNEYPFAKIYGSRFMPGSKLQGYSATRRLGNHVLNLICSVLVGRRVYDLGSGLNLYRQDYFSQEFVYSCSDSLTFNNELLLAEPRPILDEKYVPISWTETDQKSNARVIHQGLETIRLAVSNGLFRRKVLIDGEAQWRYETDFNSLKFCREFD